MILPSFVWLQYQRVTDGRTDGRNCRSYYTVLHCKQCGRAVKKSIKKCKSYNTVNKVALVLYGHGVYQRQSYISV